MLSGLPSVFVDAVLISALYALIAIGFTMIFGVGGVLNLAHGALLMAGAYAFLLLTRDQIPVYFFDSFTVSPLVAFPIAVVTVTVLSCLLYVGIVQFVEDNPINTFLVTIVVALIATEVALHYSGTQAVSYTIVGEGGLLPQLVDLGPAGGVVMEDILAFVASMVAIGLLWLYVTKTDSGRAIRATSMSERGAELTGVNVHWVRIRTWAVAGALAGIGGIFLGGAEGVAPDLWLTPLSLAFIIVVIGGIGSIKGSIVAAYLIGFLQTGVQEYIGPEYRGILSLVVLIVVLFVRPQGFYGREYHE